VLTYRVIPHLPSARTGQPGHALYEHRPQRGRRIDHPDYHVWYLSRLAEAACGETFGNLARWEPTMLEFPQLPGARRALGIYQLPDDLRVLDLDDPAQLTRLGLRPKHPRTHPLRDHARLIVWPLASGQVRTPGADPGRVGVSDDTVDRADDLFLTPPRRRSRFGRSRIATVAAGGHGRIRRLASTAECSERWRSHAQ
jgi:hypothetical protein